MSGHTQLLKMSAEGQAKVDKSIKITPGYGVANDVFDAFLNHWKDEWRRRLISQAGCEALLAEWQSSLNRFYKPHVMEAITIAKINVNPPTLDQFVSIVRGVVGLEVPKSRDRELGRHSLQRIRSIVKPNGGVDGSSKSA